MNVLFYLAAIGDMWDKLIGFWTHGKFSHCELLFSDGMCFSSSPRDGGVRFKHVNINPAHWVIIEVPMDPDKEANMRKWCGSQVGMPYDWIGIAALSVSDPTKEKYKWYCSQICIAALNKVGAINLFPEVSPNQFYNELTNPPLCQ